MNSSDYLLLQPPPTTTNLVAFNTVSYFGWFLLRVFRAGCRQVVAGVQASEKLPHSDICWLMLAVCRDLSWGCPAKHLLMGSSCGLGFFTAWRLGSKGYHPKPEKLCSITFFMVTSMHKFKGTD